MYFNYCELQFYAQMLRINSMGESMDQKALGLKLPVRLLALSA